MSCAKKIILSYGLIVMLVPNVSALPTIKIPNRISNVTKNHVFWAGCGLIGISIISAYLLRNKVNHQISLPQAQDRRSTNNIHSVSPNPDTTCLDALLSPRPGAIQLALDIRNEKYGPGLSGAIDMLEDCTEETKEKLKSLLEARQLREEVLAEIRDIMGAEAKAFDIDLIDLKNIVARKDLTLYERALIVIDAHPIVSAAVLPIKNSQEFDEVIQDNLVSLVGIRQLESELLQSIINNNKNRKRSGPKRGRVFRTRSFDKLKKRNI